jgi:hypothetical protein
MAKKLDFKTISRRVAYENGVRRCPCCGVQLLWRGPPKGNQNTVASVDHIIPKSMGGTNSIKNMFIMCQKCNTKRDTQCFVTFVTEHGVSKHQAEELYRQAHIDTLQVMIVNLFQAPKPDQDRNQIIVANKKLRKQMQDVVKNYVDYFGDHLPEFQLLEKVL